MILVELWRIIWNLSWTCREFCFA